VSAGSAGALKPAAAPFLCAAHTAGLADLRQMLHVGDSVRDDVCGAHRLGLRSVLLQRPEGSSFRLGVGAFGAEPPVDETKAKKADAKISTLRQLERLVEAWGIDGALPSSL
ncbi:unnamed protein product, partial [Polarella glacialis]